MTSTPTANISQYFLDYLKNKMSDTINDFTEEVATSYKVDAKKIIDIWNKVCPDIEIKLRKENKEVKVEKKVEKEVKIEKKKNEKNELISIDDVLDSVYGKENWDLSGDCDDFRGSLKKSNLESLIGKSVKNNSEFDENGEYPLHISIKKDNKIVFTYVEGDDEKQKKIIKSLDELDKKFKIIFNYLNRPSKEIEKELDEELSKQMKEVKKVEKKKEVDNEDNGISGPDSEKIYDKSDVIDILVKMLNKNELRKDQLKPEVDNLKSIKKLLQNYKFEVSKSVIKRILKKPDDIIKKCELKSKFVSVEQLEEFTMDE